MFRTPGSKALAAPEKRGGLGRIATFVNNAAYRILELFTDKAIPAASDVVGEIDFYGRDSAANKQIYASVFSKILDPTHLSEDSNLVFQVMDTAAPINALVLGSASISNRYAHVFDLGANRFSGLQVQNSSADDGGAMITLFQDSASPAANDYCGNIWFYGRDSAANAQVYCELDCRITDPTSGSEDSVLETWLMSAGTEFIALTIGQTSVWGGAVSEAVVALTDGATPALDASLGNVFTLSAAGNRTIAVPTNPTSGQKIVIRHLASGGARTLALNTGAGGFRFGTDITGLTATTSGKYDYIGAIYNSAASFWDVVSYVKGF